MANEHQLASCWILACCSCCPPLLLPPLLLLLLLQPFLLMPLRLLLPPQPLYYQHSIRLRPGAQNQTNDSKKW